MKSSASSVLRHHQQRLRDCRQGGQQCGDQQQQQRLPGLHRAAPRSSQRSSGRGRPVSRRRREPGVAARCPAARAGTRAAARAAQRARSCARATACSGCGAVIGVERRGQPRLVGAPPDGQRLRDAAGRGAPRPPRSRTCSGRLALEVLAGQAAAERGVEERRPRPAGRDRRDRGRALAAGQPVAQRLRTGSCSASRGRVSSSASRRETSTGTGMYWLMRPSS